jgi:hypothetical protein
VQQKKFNLNTFFYKAFLAAVGLAGHVFIAIVAALLFVLAGRRIPVRNFGSRSLNTMPLLGMNF